jgi:ribosomal protein S18 acetylase RimI-like enzyme
VWRPLAGRFEVVHGGRTFGDTVEVTATGMTIGCLQCTDASPTYFAIRAVIASGFAGTWINDQAGIALLGDDVPTALATQTVWPEFADAAILQEIGAGRLMRVLDGDVVAGVFSVAYEDPAIWGEQERGAHVYLHRIARAAEYRGRGLIDAVLAWALPECRTLGREGLRMDTWASNEALIGYYVRLGFRPVGRQRIAPDPRLPLHYHGVELALLERPCADAPGPLP